MSDPGLPNIPSNNYCDIFISSISKVSLVNNILTVDISIFIGPGNLDRYKGAHIEYALYDRNNNFLGGFFKVEAELLPVTRISVPIRSEGACKVAFRLRKPCEQENEQIGGSGSESGSEYQSGGEESGIVTVNTLFDASSWKNLSGSIPIKYYLDQAAEQWNNIIKYNNDVFSIFKQQHDPNWNGLALISYQEIYEPDGFIAACGPVEAINIIANDPYSIKMNSISFALWVNTYYKEDPWRLSANDWINVMVHELGHALGIGIYWDLYNNYWLDGSKYQLSSTAYNTIIGDTNNNRTLVPIEDSGFAGTQSAHWENNNRESTYPNSNNYNYPGCVFDIMIGYFDPNNLLPISNLSRQFLIDIGYESTGAVLPAPSIQIFPQYNLQPTQHNNIVHNMCGSSEKCGCDTRTTIGTVDLINNQFTIQG
jgi:hypothetical protein